MISGNTKGQSIWVFMKRILDIAGATLAWLLASSNKLKIDSYGQSSSNMTPEEIQI